MDSSVICPAEDAVQAFLDYLVDPMLPAKSSVQDIPNLAQQQSVAKQVHAALLLYNYYQRKQHPELEFLDFVSFSKLAVILKPPLLTYMKLMQTPNDAELDDLEKQISVTEKAIMDASDICKTLGALKDVPNPEGWPISKVAVLLVNSEEENCFLQFSSITQGVWSLIEKDVDIPAGSNHSSERAFESKHVYKKKKITRKPLTDPGAGEDDFQQLAFSAVKDATDIKQTDLMILERHVIYSLSKEKTAAKFYIMRRTQTIDDDIIEVPIKEVINSLHGPLVKKSSCNWTATPVVEFFHVLPYAEIITQRFSRDVFSNSLQDGHMRVDNSLMTEKPCDIEVNQKRDGPNGSRFAFVDTDNNTPCSNIESPKQIDNNECCMNGLSNDFSGLRNTNDDHSRVVSSKNEEKSNNIPVTIQIELHQEKTTSFMENGQNVSPSAFKVQAEKVDPVVQCTAGHAVEKVTPGKKTCNILSSNQDGMPTGDQALVTWQSDLKHLHKLQTIATKEYILSQTALQVLLRKKDKLVQQQRNIEDEIAQCEKNIQTILNDGEDDLALKLESIIEGCNDVSRSSAAYTDKTNHHSVFGDQVLPKCLKRKRLSEAVLSMQNPCQELDVICYKNNWILPTYRVYPSEGGFQADITIKGMDFECSSSGDKRANPREARESAASQILTRLRSMVREAQ